MPDKFGCGLVLLVGAVLATYYAIVEIKPQISGEVVVYNGFCTKPLDHGACPGDEQWSGISTYKASFQGQFVVWYGQDFGPDKYSNCAVADLKNWSCKFEKDSAGLEKQISMKDGMINDDSFRNTQFYQIPAWKWYELRIVSGKQQL